MKLYIFSILIFFSMPFYAMKSSSSSADSSSDESKPKTVRWSPTNSRLVVNGKQKSEEHLDAITPKTIKAYLDELSLKELVILNSFVEKLSVKKPEEMVL